MPDGVKNPSFEDVKADAEDLLQAKVADLNWFSTYRVQHRVADRFTVGRAFLLGDAGHLHSPVGGQGMNTGIGDAVNLAWKLSAVIRGRAAPAILDSYEPERIAFARELVATTDRLFRIAVSKGLAGQLYRTLVLPTAIPAATHFEAGRRALFRTASQIGVHYPDSPLSAGRAGGVRGGDRLPWLEEDNNFASLETLDWRLHVYGQPQEALAAEAGRRGLPLDAFPWSERAKQAGLAKDAAYLVRPDGHVGLAATKDAAEALSSYAERHHLGFAHH